MRDALRRLHRDEGGAIIVLMLVGVLILLLLGWTLYDGIGVTNDKAEVQAAADMAALSQASVKARSMNMMAYANISKRSIVAIHSTYIASFLAYGQLVTVMRWVGSFLNETFDGPLGSFGGDLKSTGNLAMNRWWSEAEADFATFSGLNSEIATQSKTWKHLKKLGNAPKLIRDAIKAGCGSAERQCKAGRELTGVTRRLVRSVEDEFFIDAGDLVDDPHRPDDWGELSTEYYAQDVEALENYQRYLAGVTPWWAWLEQLARGMRNGATVTSSSPMPTGMPNLTDRFVRLISDAFDFSLGFLETTAINDTLPVRPGVGPQTHKKQGKLAPKHPGEDYMGRKIQQKLRGDTSVASMVDAVVRSMEEGGEGPNLKRRVTRRPFAVEHLVNLLLTTINSDWVEWQGEGQLPGFQLGFGASLFSWTSHIAKRKAPMVSQKVFDEALGPYVVNPWVLNRYRTRADWLAHSSNIVFSYMNRGDVDRERQKYDIVGGRLGRRSSISDTHWEAVYEVSGSWGMARSEISFQGPDGMQPDLWHPNWVARLRPVALSREEFAETPVSLARAFHDAMPGILLTSLIGAVGTADLRSAGRDIASMERAVRGMGESTVEGVVR